MKLNENFILKTVAGSPVVMPVGDAVASLHGMIKLNAPAELIWRALEKNAERSDILAELKSVYPTVSDERLSEDLDGFLLKLKEHGILED